jgi:hypothetical protein
MCLGRSSGSGRSTVDSCRSLRSVSSSEPGRSIWPRWKWEQEGVKGSGRSMGSGTMECFKNFLYKIYIHVINTLQTDGNIDISLPESLYRHNMNLSEILYESENVLACDFRVQLTIVQLYTVQRNSIFSEKRRFYRWSHTPNTYFLCLNTKMSVTECWGE